MSFLFRWGSNSKDSPSSPSSSSSIPQTPQPGSSSSSPDGRQHLPSSSSSSTSTNQNQHQLDPSTTTTTTTTTTISTPTPELLPNNLKLLIGGATFFMLSTLITRRSIHRRKIACIPPFYTGSTYHKPRVNGAVEAFEALNIATINVVSVAMIAAGATMYAFDINTLEDMRRRVRSALDVDRPGEGAGSGTSATDKELEKDLEEWISTVLDRKDFSAQLKRLTEGREQEGSTNEKGKEQ